MLTLACASPASADAVWDTHAPEHAFVFRGKPVDPRCVAPIMGPGEGNSDVVDLARCTKRVARKSSVGRDHGGFFTSDQNEGADNPEDQEYDYYRVVARSGDLFALDTSVNTGGTGEFEGVFLVRLSQDKLAHVETLGYGDRCNGGSSFDAVKGASLRWSESLTPADVILLTAGKNAGASDLPDSAISCVATQDMEYDLGTHKRRWVSLTLTGLSDVDTGSKSKLLDESAGLDMPELCFNRLYNGYIRGTRLVLAASVAKQLGADYIHACQKKKSH